MNNKKILEAKKAIENLIDNWLDDEEACYLENLKYLLKNNKYKDCEYHKELYNDYHKELYNDKIKLSDIPKLGFINIDKLFKKNKPNRLTLKFLGYYNFYYKKHD